MLNPGATTALMKLSSAIFSLCLCGGSVALALDKPAATHGKIAATDEAGQRAAAETAAAIEALGAHPATRQISNIVFKAVRTSPDSVLPIVHAAVRVSPQGAAPEIVTAATAAVPDPWKKVGYRRIAVSDLKKRGVKKSDPDFKGGPDGKHAVDFKGGPDGKTPVATEGPEVTLAEAITRTAFDAQPGLSLPALVSAADIALLTDPATLLRYVQSPRSISGVGDAGTSNYANEPLRPSVSGTPPVPAPNPPVVSK